MVTIEDEVRIIHQYAYNETVLTPVSVACILFAIVLVMVLDRRYLVVPMLVVSLLIPEMDRIVIGGIGLNTLRIMCIFGFLRYILCGLGRRLRLNHMDKCIIVWSVVGVVLNTIQWRRTDILVGALGGAFSALTLYFIFRCYLSEFDGYEVILKTFAFICVVLAVMMVVESRTGKNFFSIFGGVPELTGMREGRVRAQGPFTHAILAGTFGAVCFPLFMGLARQDRVSKVYGWVGAVASVLIVITSASSGPVLSLLAGMIGLLVWIAHKRMREVRRALILALVALQINMKAPIYALLARVDIVGGSTGYHRFLLVDAFVKHFREWVVFGSGNAAYWGWGLQDVTNQFVAEGLKGGLLTLALFGALIVLAFRQIGLYLRGAANISREGRILIWCLGASLFVHVVSFLGISYFDQIIVAWYSLLAMAGSLPEKAREQPLAASSLGQREHEECVELP